MWTLCDQIEGVLSPDGSHFQGQSGPVQQLPGPSGLHTKGFCFLKKWKNSGCGPWWL